MTFVLGVHRSLGTHLTFIRSADLDQAWTWKQLRCMQVGGNGKARAFFRANGGETNDKQVKYNSRAANLYKAKIQKLVSFFSLKIFFFFFVCPFLFCFSV